MSLLWNLIILILCGWALFGFVGYGVMLGQLYKGALEDFVIINMELTKEKIILLICCLIGGPISLVAPLYDGFYGLRFW